MKSEGGRTVPTFELKNVHFEKIAREFTSYLSKFGEVSYENEKSYRDLPSRGTQRDVHLDGEPIGTIRCVAHMHGRRVEFQGKVPVFENRFPEEQRAFLKKEERLSYDRNGHPWVKLGLSYEYMPNEYIGEKGPYRSDDWGAQIPFP